MQDFTKTSGATSATFLPSPNSPCLIPEKLPIKFQGRDWPSEKPKNATLADLEKVACGDPEKAETLEARKKLRRDWLLENGARVLLGARKCCAGVAARSKTLRWRCWAVKSVLSLPPQIYLVWAGERN